MKTKSELEQDIIQLTTKIREDFPELIKYITEMPVIDTDDEDKIIHGLQDYYSSLNKLLNEYSKTHPADKS